MAQHCDCLLFPSSRYNDRYLFRKRNFSIKQAQFLKIAVRKNAQILFSRFPSRLCGCCRKDVMKRHWNRYNGNPQFQNSLNSFFWTFRNLITKTLMIEKNRLRGWVKPDAVRAEFDSLRRYREHSNSCATCEKSRVACTHPRLTLKEKLKDLMRKRTLKAFIITLCCFFSAHFAGILQLRSVTVDKRICVRIFQ